MSDEPVPDDEQERQERVKKEAWDGFMKVVGRALARQYREDHSMGAPDDCEPTP